MRVIEIFPDSMIVSALRRQLSWTSIKTIIYIEESLKRDFYIEMAKMEHWGTRILQGRINSMLFEHTAVNRRGGGGGMKKMATIELYNEKQVFSNIALIIEKRKFNAASSANSQVITMFWEIGKYINLDILADSRADYGKKILSTVSTKLVSVSFRLRKP
ncbi:hypothetical protein FACS189447_05720 [Spirochaetia bacterium]|nr:hypothetical protein FACS189447_05720 [Spirochaetia bacterium]